MVSYDLIDVPVDGGTLRVASWDETGGAGPVVFAAHGITANHLMWQLVADRLPGVRIVAPDLRGRGDSNALGEPYGMATHVRDAVATLDHLGIDRATIVGGSMGGYVAVLIAARHPERVSAVGLCDGGVALPLPDGVDPEQVLQATLGPSLERLDMTFDSLDDYVAFWQRHPALVDDWNDALEAFVRYDTVTVDGGAIRSKVSKPAIIADGRDLLLNEDVHRCISDISCPTWLLRAPRGLLNQPEPLIPDVVLEAWRGEHLPQLEVDWVDDVNHWTLFLSERGATAIADRIRASVPALA